MNFLFVLASLCVGVFADLPIHCLNKDVSGEWTLTLGPLADTFQDCGFRKPDNSKYHFGKIRPTVKGKTTTTQITLNEPNIAVDAKGVKGTWTMVYDEGFEVTMPDMVYFAFSDYKPKPGTSLSSEEVSDYVSICDKTMVGWYRSADLKQFGCWKGAKLEGSGQQTLGTLPKPSLRSEHVVSPNALLQKGDEEWKPDYSLVEMINSDTKSTWKAKVHEQFVGKRMREMQRLLGVRLNAAPGKRNLQKDMSLIDSNPDYGSLPESLDWRDKDGVNYDISPENQGSCGSCYIIAAMSSIESRFRVASKNKFKPKLSEQDVLSCSIMNQGCEGGYPFLVAKYGKEVGFAPESCASYSASDIPCYKEHCSEKKLRLKHYEYTGGYYGGGGEVAMMKDIAEHGPMMVAFEAPSSLFYYHGGIYKGPKPTSEDEHVPGVNIWEKTNHAVVAVGWGVESGEKYWIIKNTWGAHWGEKGYFRIRRGTDECGIESMSVNAHVQYP